MSFCLKCGKYSHGNKYCYECYQEELQKSIVKNSKAPNTCIKCTKTMKQLVYCEDCYKKHIALKIDDILFKYYNDYSKKENALEQKRTSLPMIEKATRKCTHCNKNALLGSYLCEDHYYTFVEEQQKKYYDNLAKINAGIIKDYQVNSYIITPTRNNICKICGACSYNMHYCNSCYNSFIQEKNNYNSFKQYEENKKYICKSGIKVRSLSEREISNFLTENNIPHIYEQEIKYKFYNYNYNQTFIKSLHPDFYIPGPVYFREKLLKDIYIEFWGFDENNIKYTNDKKYKIKTYKELGITLINTTAADLTDINKSLIFKLLNFEYNNINF